MLRTLCYRSFLCIGDCARKPCLDKDTAVDTLQSHSAEPHTEGNLTNDSDCSLTSTSADQKPVWSTDLKTDLYHPIWSSRWDPRLCSHPPNLWTILYSVDSAPQLHCPSHCDSMIESLQHRAQSCWIQVKVRTSAGSTSPCLPRSPLATCRHWLMSSGTRLRKTRVAKAFLLEVAHLGGVSAIY